MRTDSVSCWPFRVFSSPSERRARGVKMRYCRDSLSLLRLNSQPLFDATKILELPKLESKRPISKSREFRTFGRTRGTVQPGSPGPKQATLFLFASTKRASPRRNKNTPGTQSHHGVIA